ncbi:dienelactone hydrolase family protein [Pontibacter sp. JH31]|uniref:Dienelactone hydrolase family protein n=1 Tax=Pontibacter aquaedesilientis TaxID=2766980 RepID=A0ABR7XHU5_9BACT|nr:dienelactone hydrolase family protein [Pontibacter aquaedesilientis]MBD1397855.1 dienelactone hydrolase family protein [Pontibacter aquaedesilientis]
MKKLAFLLALCLFIFQAATAQEKMSCCVKPASNEATTQFAMLANDKSFVEKHENPLPFTLQKQAGKTITYKTPDGKTASAYEIKAAKKTNNYLFVIHEWWGLNDYIKQEAERLHRELGDVNVIALDLYDGKIAKEREQAMQYMQAVNNERAKAIIQGAITYAGSKADITTIGWCFGGGWSLQAALLAGNQAEAAVIYYGMPERDVERLKTLKAPVLGIFAEQDGSITPEIVRDFEAKMKEADKKVTIKMYDAVHAFANPSNPKYDQEAAEDAHKLAVEFIRKHLDE